MQMVVAHAIRHGRGGPDFLDEEELLSTIWTRLIAKGMRKDDADRQLERLTWFGSGVRYEDVVAPMVACYPTTGGLGVGGAVAVLDSVGPANADEHLRVMLEDPAAGALIEYPGSGQMLGSSISAASSAANGDAGGGVEFARMDDLLSGMGQETQSWLAGLPSHD